MYINDKIYIGAKHTRVYAKMRGLVPKRSHDMRFRYNTGILEWPGIIQVASEEEIAGMAFFEKSKGKRR